jgi:hypothetical protein
VQLCDWQVIGTPFDVMPVAPIGEQNAPAVTAPVAGALVGRVGAMVGVVVAMVGTVVAIVGRLVVTSAVVVGRVDAVVDAAVEAAPVVFVEPPFALLEQPTPTSAMTKRTAQNARATDLLGSHLLGFARLTAKDLVTAGRRQRRTRSTPCRPSNAVRAE